MGVFPWPVKVKSIKLSLITYLCLIIVILLPEPVQSLFFYWLVEVDNTESAYNQPQRDGQTENISDSQTDGRDNPRG